MHQMVINTPCVIDHALLGVGRANQARILDQRKSIMLGIVQPTHIGMRSLVVLDMIRMLGRCHVILKMKGVSELGR